MMIVIICCSPAKIKDLLGEGVVDDKTRLVLVNAVYFKGNWNKQFEEVSTADGLFRTTKVRKHNNSTGWRTEGTTVVRVRDIKIG